MKGSTPLVRPFFIMDKDKLTDSLLRAMVGGTLDRRPRDPAGFPVNVNRPIIPNPLTGGLRSTEFSRSHEMEGREYDFPSIGNLYGKTEFLPPEQYILAALLRSGDYPMGLQEIPNFPMNDPNRIKPGLRSHKIGQARETAQGANQAMGRISPHAYRRNR